jgi:membrane protease YdiL (CAAX protease family)
MQYWVFSTALWHIFQRLVLATIPMIMIIISYLVPVLLVEAAVKFFKFRTNPVQVPEPRKSAIFSMAGVLSTIVIITIVFLFIQSRGQSFRSAVPATDHAISHARNIWGILLLSAIALAPSLFILRRRKEPLSSTGISSHQLRGSIILGWGIIIIQLAQVIYFSGLPFREFTSELGGDLLRSFVYFSIVGWSEEFLFRGYLQSRLAAWFGNLRGWIVASIIMALSHIPQRYGVMGLALEDSVASSLQLLPNSFFAGYLMMRTQNVTVPAMYHTIADWIGTLGG